MTTTLGWVDRTTPKEEGRRKSYGQRRKSRIRGGVGGLDLVHNIVVDP